MLSYQNGGVRYENFGLYCPKWPSFLNLPNCLLSGGRLFWATIISSMATANFFSSFSCSDIFNSHFQTSENLLKCYFLQHTVHKTAMRIQLFEQDERFYTKYYSKIVRSQNLVGRCLSGLSPFFPGDLNIKHIFPPKL